MILSATARASTTRLDSILADPGLRRELARGLDAVPSAEAAAMAAQLAAYFGPATLAVIHYGSRARGVDAREDSAYDFFVIVEDYRSAYRSLASSLQTRIGPGSAVTLAHLLPPNVHAIPPAPDGSRLNKCGVLSIAMLERAAQLGTADHFAIGRLFQQVQLLWTRDEQSAESVRAALTELRARTFEWGRTFLPETFDADDYCRTLLATSFAGEIRPEASGRASDLLDAQRAILVPSYAALLETLTEAGLLERAGDGYRQVVPPTPRERRRWRRYFRVSKARACVRWAKHVVLYDGWLDYIARKVTRHGGGDVELTERERRWPLIFLWPKIIRFFRDRARREARA